jgi:hypothetical protein
MRKAKVWLIVGCVFALASGIVRAQTILDDFETGTKAPNKMGGIWYTFNDNKSSTTPGSSKDSIYFGCTDVYGAPSTKSINVKFNLDDTLGNPNCGFGTYVNAAKVCGDLSNYGGITVHYKGPFSQNGYAILRIEDSTTIAANPTKSSYYYTQIISSQLGWDTLFVPWAGFGFSSYSGTTPPPNGMDLTRVVKISFQFKGIMSMPDTDQFYLDDIVLEPPTLGTAPKIDAKTRRSTITILLAGGGVSITGMIEPSLVTISDLEGRVITSAQVRKNGFSAFGRPHPGIYFVNVKNNRQEAGSKVLVIR